MSSPREAQLPLLLSISEGLSRGTDEMLRVSPQGDAIHPPSCSLAIRESVEEIKWLRAEVERQARHIEELREKIDAERSCACSFDAPGDVCAAHSPALMRARAEVERLRAERDTLLLDARDFLRWFNRNYPDPSGHSDHPWCALNNRLNAHADTLSALDSGLGAEP